MKAKATLISSTPDAVPLMCWVRRAMHSKIPDSLEELKSNPKKWLGKSLDDYFNQILLQDGMPTFLEYVNTVWKLEGVSRALTHQLVRHRIGFAFSQQSMRCVRAESFAKDGNFHLPGTVKNKNLYTNCMKEVEKLYNQLLESGVSTQDARGILPTNVHTVITFSANLRALFGMLNKRLCYKTQGEFQQLAKQMVEQVGKIDKRLLKFVGPPCEVTGHCIMKAENEEQLREGKLKGKQNTEQVCPRYMERKNNE